MADISLMDLVAQGAQTVNTIIGVWGVNQEARRRAQYQDAITQANIGFGEIMKGIQANQDYSQHQQMFTEGSTQLHKDISSRLDDPVVRQQFDLQWSPINANAMAAAQEYTRSREQVAIVTSGVKNVLATHEHGDFVQAQMEAAPIIQDLFDTGMIDEAGVEEFWGKWHQSGAMLVDQRRQDAIEARNVGQLENVITQAYVTGVIASEELAAQLIQEGTHKIYFDTMRDQAHSMGFGPGMQWIMDPTNATNLSGDERDAIFTELVKKRDWARDEERYKRDESDRSMKEEANDLESQIRQHKMSWAQGLAWLERDEVMASLTQSSWEHLFDRWQSAMEDELAEPDEAYFASPDVQDDIMETVTQMIMNETPWKEVNTYIDGLRYKVDGLIPLPYSKRMDLRNLNEAREKLASPVEDAIMTALEDYGKNLSEGQKARLYRQVLERVPSLQQTDDRTGNVPEWILMDRIDETVKHLADPVHMQNVDAESLRMESIFGGTGVNLLDDPERANIALLNNEHYGTIDTPRFYQALYQPSSDEGVIKDVFLMGRNYDALSRSEKTVIDNNVEFTQYAKATLATFTEQFGYTPRISMNPNESAEVFALSDGTIAMRTRENQLVRLKVDPSDKKDEQWYVYEGGAWNKSDALNAPVETVQAPGVGGIVDAALAGVQEAKEQEAQVYNAIAEKIRAKLDGDTTLSPVVRSRLESLVTNLERGGGALNMTDLQLLRAAGISVTGE